MNGIILWCAVSIISVAGAEKSVVETSQKKGSCTPGCDTFWIQGDKEHTIKCSRQESATCTASPGSHPGQPYSLTKEGKEWYKFNDSDNNMRLALNISWKPRYDDSISSVKGFGVEILKEAADFTTSALQLCFTLGTKLTTNNFVDCPYFRSNKTCGNEFFYDCYGHDENRRVEPGDKFHVLIYSLPMSRDFSSGNDKTMFKIEIPECVDPHMKDVIECKRQGDRTITAKVERIFCENRTVKYSYDVHPEYGSPAIVTLCETDEGKNRCAHSIKEETDKPLNGTHYLSLRSDAKLSVPYLIQVGGSSEKYKDRTQANVNFTHCIPPQPATPDENPLVIGILIAAIVILIVVLLVLLWYYKDRFDILKKVFWCLRRQESGETQYTQSRIQGSKEGAKAECIEAGIVYGPRNAPLNGSPPRTATDTGQPQQLAAMPPIDEHAKPPRVYVVFTEDHELHKDVVHWFCSYLKADLNMDVKMSMWDSIDAAANPLMYMNYNLKHADKVIILCSAGTRKCLDRPEWQGDMFTPVVRNIIQESFVGRNPGKFLVAYFNYSEPKDIPEYLYDQTQMYFSLFKLMKQFEQFYFRLAGIEQYHEGGIRRIEKIAFDRYYDPALSTCGRKLKEAIDAMTDFCERNPTWFIDQKGEGVAAVDLPPPPSEAPSTFLATDGFESKASIATLEISRPTEIPPPAVGGARRKVANTPNNPPMKAPAPMPLKEHVSVKEESVQNDESFMIEDSLEEESFMIPEGESLSSHAKPSSKLHHPSRPLEHDDMSNSSDAQRRPVPTEHDLHQVDSGYIPSFHPGSFTDLNGDISLDQKNQSLENHTLAPPSKQAPICYIGKPEHVEMEEIPEADELSPSNTKQDHKDGYHKPGGFSITLANVDECDVDFEDEFKSINLSVQI